MPKLQLPKAVLFDLDGTLLTSFQAVERSWTRIVQEANLDWHLLSQLHGVPSRGVLTILLGEERIGELDELCERILRYEVEDTEGVQPIEGARELLRSLESAGVPWGIVTSCERPLASARLAAANLPEPELLITFDDVVNGKPAPDPYLLGAERAGVSAVDAVVIEDAPAGITSGKAAGAFVVGVAQTHLAADLHQADLVLDNLSALHQLWFD